MPDAYFYLHYDTRQEVLADLLLGKLQAEGGNDPFYASRVLVRNQGMATWLRQRFARGTGLAMQVDFPQPGRFLQGVLGGDPVSTEELQWRIYRELPKLGDTAQTRAIYRYLGEDAGAPESALKRYQLAGRLSNLYDKYLLYRPDWIRAWERGESVGSAAHEGWQRQLWQRIGEGGLGRHWTQRLLDAEPIDFSGLGTAPLHVFGISHFAPIYVQFLYLISQQVPVHVYWMNPVDGYWGDGPSNREWILAKAFEDPEILMAHNPLLASFGRLGREFVHTIYGGESGDHDVQEEEIPAAQTAQATDAETELGRLQRHIHANRPSDLLGCEDGDDSLVIHSCHTPMREVETLRNHLLRLADKRPLDTAEVLVMCPDIREYAPVIEAVFGATARGDGLPHLPYQISDRNTPLDEPAISTLVGLFGLRQIRFTNSEALSILSTPAIAARFDLAEADLATIREWITGNGIRWGFDAAHVGEIAAGCPDTPWTWRDGLERMLLGYAMPRPGGAPIFWEGILPFHDIEGDHVRVLDGLCAFVNWCEGIRDELAVARPLAEWVEVVRGWIHSGYDVEASQTQELLRPLMKVLDKIRQQAGFIAEELPADVFAEHLEDLLGDGGTGRGFLTGAITFCEMKPMRAVPARVVCMLGMNYDNFPRQGRETQFDLTLGERRFGDRLSRDDDCYCFLEALLSARESIFMSFVGRFVKDGKQRPPATPLQTLMDHVPGLAGRVVHEKLYAFDPEYFKAGSLRRSYDRELLEAAQALEGNRQGERPRLQVPAEEDENQPVEEITVDEFVRWLTHSPEQFMRQRLRAQRCYLDAPMQENEALEIDGKAGWRMKQKMLERSYQLSDQAAAWRQEGMVPAGRLGDEALGKLFGGVEEILGSIPEPSPMKISVEAAGLKIHGHIPVAENDGVQCAVVIDASGGKASEQLSAWIYSLLASAEMGYAVAGMLYGLKKNQYTGVLGIGIYGFLGGDASRQHLEDLVELVRRAQAAPLPHFPGTAEAYMGVSPKLDETEEAVEERRRAAALKKWEGGKYSTGESENEAIRLLFGSSSADLFSEEFLATTRAIWGPLVGHRNKQ